MSERPPSTAESTSDDQARHLGRLAAAEQLSSSAYELLTLDDPELSHAMRRSYLRNTYRLVEKIQQERPDYVLYLDKSGRPVSWMVNELYDDFVQDPESSQGAWPKPGTLFLNIDREHWRDDTGGKEFGSGQIDAGGVDASVIATLRTIFAEREPQPGDEIATMKSLLDDKRILIVDEVRFTGDTLKIAEALLKRAFPDTEFATHHWMTSPKAAVPGAKSSGLPDVPVWYRQTAEWGRGVGNRSFDAAQRSTSWRQRRGAIFLSRRFEPPDPASLTLRREVKQLAGEYRQGEYGSVVY